MKRFLGNVSFALGVIIFSVGIGPGFPALALQSSLAQAKPAELLNQGQDKLQRGDRPGAIRDFTQVIQAQPEFI